MSQKCIAKKSFYLQQFLEQAKISMISLVYMEINGEIPTICEKDNFTIIRCYNNYWLLLTWQVNVWDLVGQNGCPSSSGSAKYVIDPCSKLNFYSGLDVVLRWPLLYWCKFQVYIVRKWFLEGVAIKYTNIHAAE